MIARRPAHIFRQMFRRNRRVLDECNRFGRATQPVSSDKPALRTLQTRFISAGSVRIFVRRPSRFELQNRQSISDIFIEFDDEKRLTRLRIQLEQITRGLKKQLAFRLVEQRSIDMLDRRGLQIEQLDRCLHRFRQSKRRK